MRRSGLIIGIIIIVAALAYSAVTFKKSLVSYVTFTEAMTATDTTVQVMGSPVPNTMLYDKYAQGTRFRIVDGEGDTLNVLYNGPKPDDLDTAMAKGAKITAQGTYDPSTHTFDADNLLVKCPSKYQGTDKVVERSYKSAT